MKKEHMMSIVVSIFAFSILFYPNCIHAAEADSKDEALNLNDVSIEERAEEAVWKYQYIDGKLYKRLWSTSSGKWLTDWIPC